MLRLNNQLWEPTTANQPMQNCSRDGDVLLGLIVGQALPMTEQSG